MKEKIVSWIAWHLPSSVAMWCFVRVSAFATMGEYGNTVLGELSVIEALERWTKRYGNT